MLKKKKHNQLSSLRGRQIFPLLIGVRGVFDGKLKSPYPLFKGGITKSFFYSFILLSFLFCGNNLFAQQTLSLKNAIDSAMKNNFSIIIAQNNTKIQENNNTYGNAGFAPKVDLNASYNLSSNNTKQEYLTGKENNNASAGSDNLNASVNLDWTLFDGGNMFITKDKLESLAQASKIQLKAAIEENIAQLVAGYYQIVAQEKMLNALAKAIEISKTKAEIAKKKLQIGSASETETLQAFVDLNSDSSAWLQQKASIAGAKANLNYLMGRAVNTPFSVDSNIEVIATVDYQKLSASLDKQNKAVLLAKKQAEIAMLSLKQTQSEMYPKLDLVGAYSFTHSSSESGFLLTNRSYGPSVGLTLTMNLYNGHKNTIQKKNARVAIENAELNEKDLQLSAQKVLYTSYQNYKSALKQIAFQKKSLSLAAKNLNIALKAYKIGSISYVELRQAQEANINAESFLLQAEYQLKVAQINMQKVSGTLVKK